MTAKLTQDSFVTLLEKSSLIAPDALAASVEEFRAENSESADSGEHLAQFLIRKGELTTWQARKLLQGKHKGFTLGKYKFLSLLGRGGMSSVYLAEHVVMRRQVAIKVLPSKQVNDKAALDRFHQEAQAAAALDDPNIVRAFDIDQVTEGKSEIHFLVMEYVEGRSLQEVVDQDGPLPVADAVDYVIQAASGLHHAHEVGMVHRDIKPSNLLLDNGGVVKVLDMGLARFFEESDDSSLTLQHDQRVLGTADYLSPEQAVDSHSVDTRSDIYCLGGTFYFLLAGHPPFPEGTLTQRLLAHQTKQPKPIIEIRPDVPPALAKILQTMMAKKADNRQDTADEVRGQLIDWLERHRSTIADVPAQVKTTHRHRKKTAEPTSAGWSNLTPEGFVPPDPSASSTGGSHVVSDPGLGEFLSNLDTAVDPARTDSDRITSAKTVISPSRRKPPSSGSDIGILAAAGVESSSDSEIREGSSIIADSASLSASRIRRQSKTPLPIPIMAGIGGGLVLLLIAAYAFWPAGDEPAAPSTGPGTVSTLGVNDPASSGPTVATNTGPKRPPVVRGEDITVGPKGHFATIGEAVDYVRENFRPLSPTEVRTIRVAGGQTYDESITIDNSVFGSFPQGVRILCEDAKPAVLNPAGSDPVVSLVNVERFRLQGFTLRGGQRSAVMRLSGYLVQSRFERLTFDDVQQTAISASGVAGFQGTGRVEFRNIVVRGSDASARGMTFAVGENDTHEILFYRCRFGGPMASALEFAGETARVEINECRFNDVNEPIRFAPASQSLDSVTISNNTFRNFDRAITLAEMPTIAAKGVGFHKNLFVGGRGSEVAVEGVGDVTPVSKIAGKAGALLNWSESTGDLANGAVDIFASEGRRGVEAIPFVSTDVTNEGSFLKPKGTELRDAAQNSNSPKFIGAMNP